MAGVAEDGQTGYAAAQFDGYLPHRQVAVDFLVVTGEAAVDGSQTLHTSLVDALQSTYPQFQVGVHGVLHQHGHVDAAQRVGEGLHGKGVGRGARANPQDVDVVFQRKFHVLGGGHLGGDEHPRLVLHPFHPGQRLLAVAFESSGFGTRFPYSRTKHMATFMCQLCGGGHHLLLGLGGAWPCDDDGSLIVAGQVQGLKFQFHVYIVFLFYYVG